MKKILVLAAMFAAAGMVYAATEEPKTLYDIQGAAYQPEKAQQIHAAKLIYEVQDKDQYFCLVVRATAKNQVRMDVIAEKEIYSTCRNGDEYWAYEPQKGFTALSPDEQKELQGELAYLALPFGEKTDIFLPLTADGQGMCGTAARKCNCYKTAMKGFEAGDIVLWADAENGLLRLVKVKCPEGLYATSFLNYKDFDGIKLATRINLAAPEGNVRLKLLSADWNISLADKVFSKSKPEEDNTLAILQKSMAGKTAVTPPVDPAKQAAAQAEKQAKKQAAAVRQARNARYRLQRQIIRQQKVVRDLEIRIAAKQKMLGTQETVFKNDRSQAAVTVSARDYISAPFRRAWSHYGWSTSSRNSRHGWRAARSLYNESAAIGMEYERTSRELTDLQIRLGDAKVELDQLMEKMEALNQKIEKMTEKDEE